MTWECRDYGDGLSMIERGTDEQGDGERFLETPLPYDDAVKVEWLLGELKRLQRIAECDCVPAAISSKSCRKCGRRATIPQEQILRLQAELIASREAGSAPQGAA